MFELFRRLRYLANRRRLDRELENDMQFHREMAARQGRNNFGNVLLLREDSRQAWGWTWIDRLIQDLHYAGRILRRSPGLAASVTINCRKRTMRSAPRATPIWPRSRCPATAVSPRNSTP